MMGEEGGEEEEKKMIYSRIGEVMEWWIDYPILLLMLL